MLQSPVAKEAAFIHLLCCTCILKVRKSSVTKRAVCVKYWHHCYMRAWPSGKQIGNESIR